MQVVTLPRLGTFAAWREAARVHAVRRTPPDQIAWQLEGDAASLFDAPSNIGDAKGDGVLTVPKTFPVLAKQLCAHRARDAFDVAYCLLTRVQDTPGLLRNRADPDVARAEALAKNIRRDMHKMKAFVRFRDVTPKDATRRQFVSWFEPDHRIEELIADFFARRFGDMDWVIITPEVTIRFAGGKVSCDAVESQRPNLQDETEELWRTYYANIFNPARVKIKAMQAEMPKKYWKNLPEADLIPGLVEQAEAQVAQMQAAAPSLPPLRAGRVLERLHERDPLDLKEGLAALHQAMAGCQNCPLAGPATQTVVGEGPADADLMIVGEQPGDHEDLVGRPFVGPAGQLFEAVAHEAGLDLSTAYVTNAVKHFKFQIKGKRRLHQNPNRGDIQHCRWWLQQEIAIIRPKLIIALGATAAQALNGEGKAITQRRGQIEEGLDGIPVLITLHPAGLLRQKIGQERDRLQALLRSDLSMAAQRYQSEICKMEIPEALNSPTC